MTNEEKLLQKLKKFNLDTDKELQRKKLLILLTAAYLTEKLEGRNFPFVPPPSLN